MNQLSSPGYQRIEFIPVFEVYIGRGVYNVTCALARYGMRANYIARLKDTVKRSFRLELLLTHLFFGILGGKPFVKYIYTVISCMYLHLCTPCCKLIRNLTSKQRPLMFKIFSDCTILFFFLLF